MGKPPVSRSLSSVPNPFFFLSFLSSQIPFSLCSLSLKSSFLPPPPPPSLSLLLCFFFRSGVLTLSVFSLLQERLCEQVEACQKRVNHRYECINIPNVFLRRMPKLKIKANAGSFITDLSLAATSCVIVEMFYLAWKMVISEN